MIGRQFFGVSMWFLMILVAALGIASASGRVMDDHSYYTKVRVGDTVTLRGEDEGKASAIYVFTDQRACYTCMLTLKSFCTAMAKRQVSVVFFVKGLSPSSTERFRKEQEVEATIVGDDMGAYFRLFRIEKPTVLMLVNGKGVVDYIGIPGTADFDPGRVVEMVGSSNGGVRGERYVVDGVRHLPVTRRMALDTTLGLSRNTSFKFQAERKRFALFDHSNRKLHIVSDAGVVDYTGAVEAKNLPYRSYGPTLVAWDRNRGLLTFDSDVMTAYPFLFFYDYVTQDADTLKFPYVERGRLSNKILYDERSGRYWIGRRPFNPSMDFVDDGASLLTMKDGAWQRQGRFDRIYFDGFNPSYYWQMFSLCKGGFVEVQNFSDTLFVHDRNGEIVRTITVTLPPEHRIAWKERMRMLTPSSPMSEVKALGDSIVRHQKILCDSTSTTCYVFFQIPMSHYTGKRLPNGDNPLVVLGRSVDIERGTLGEVFEVPLGAIVQDIDDGMAIATNIGPTRSELVWLALPK